MSDAGQVRRVSQSGPLLPVRLRQLSVVLRTISDAFGHSAQRRGHRAWWLISSSMIHAVLRNLPGWPMADRSWLSIVR